MAAAGTAALALMTATQVYLSMWDHGHSFVRMVAWQMASWAFWICGAPWILRLAGRGARLRVLVPLGVVLMAIHVLLAGLAAAWSRPFSVGDVHGFVPYPLIPSILVTLPYVVLVDPVLYVLLVVGGRALAASERAWRLRCASRSSNPTWRARSSTRCGSRSSRTSSSTR